MIDEIIIPILYFLLLLLIIGNKRFFKSKSISKPLLLISFSIKVFCSILYGYLFKSGLLTGDDTYLYFSDGNVVYSAFKTDPVNYFKLALGANDFIPVPKSFFPYVNSLHFWFDYSNYFLVRLNSLIRFFSFGVYNVHAIVFAFISFVGIYNLYLFFENKVTNKILLQCILFGIPSVVFWTSGIHKEALAIFGLGLILYNLDQIISGKRTAGTLFFLLMGLFFLGYVRFYLLVILFPLVLSMIISLQLKNKISSITIYISIIGLFCFIALLIDILSPRLNLIHEFFVRRTYFLHTLPGNMTFKVVSNVPKNVTDYFVLIWEALSNPFIRPLPTECSNLLTVLACLETWFFLAMIIILLRSADIKSFFNNSYSIFSILFGLSILFLIGLIVNNSGAIVRYRSIAIPFIMIGLCIAGKENKQVVENSN